MKDILNRLKEVETEEKRLRRERYRLRVEKRKALAELNGKPQPQPWERLVSGKAAEYAGYGSIHLLLSAIEAFNSSAAENEKISVERRGNSFYRYIRVCDLDKIKKMQ